MPKAASSKSTRKSKDSNTPKRRRSAYLLFTLEKRKELKRENPSLGPQDMLKELGAQWKAADQQTRQHYQKLADAEKGGQQQKSNDDQNDKENNKKGKVNQSMEVNASP